MSQRKVAIVGTAPSSWGLAPFGDETWEIWGCAGLFNRVPRYDRWYELHRPDLIGQGWESEDAVKQYRQFLVESEKPVYMQDSYDAVPASVRYPLERAVESFGRYFCSTISYMLAHALLEDVDALGVWGVDMALDSEYADQRPSCEYFIGIARGMGKPVHVPEECDLLKTRLLYAFEHDQGYTAKIRAKKEEAKQRKQQFTQQRQQARIREAAFDGVIDTLEWLDRTFGDYGAPGGNGAGPAEAIEEAEPEKILSGGD